MSVLNIIGNKSERNYIINGNFDFWQRGTSGTTGYIADRMQVLAASATTRSTDVPSNGLSTYSMQLAQSSVNYGYFTQKLESYFVKELHNKTVTLSFWAKSIVGSSALYIDINQANVVDNFSAVTGVYTGVTMSATPSGSWTQYSYTFVVTPTMAINGFQIVIVRNNTTTNTTLYTQIKLNEGTAATEFTRAGRNYEDELTLCKRYYQRSWAAGVAYPSVVHGGSLSGISYSTTEVWLTLNFPVEMRTIPTVNLYDNAGNTGRIHRANFGDHPNAVTADHDTKGINRVTTSGLTVGVLYVAGWSADAEL